MVAYVTANNIMPPWRADESYAPLKRYNSLNETEMEAIKNWAEKGFPEGTPDEETAEPTFHTPKDTGRTIVAAMQRSFSILPDYTERAQVFVIDLHSNKDEWISSVQFVPGNRSVVKSCTISLDTGYTGALFDSYDEKYGYSSQVGLSFIPSQYYWYQWTPDDDDNFFTLPAPLKLLRGSRVLMHISYAAADTEQQDSSFVKFKVTGNPPDSTEMCAGILVDSNHVSNAPFVINKGDKKKVFASRKFDHDQTIISLMPMGQFALSSWEIYAMDSATGLRIPLLKIPHWDAHWKKKYYLAKPVTISAGSSIFATGYYNNSDDNRSLVILPPKQIKYGEGQRDELFLVQYDYLKKKADLKK